MANDPLQYLFALTLASSAAIAVTSSLRHAVRRLSGTTAAYCAWLLVPIAMIAVVLPHADHLDSARDLVLQVDSASGLTRALGRSLGSVAQSALQGSTLLLGVWGAGGLFFLGYLTAQQRAFISSLGPLSGSGCVRRAEHSAGCPALLGLIRPNIVLPADFESRYTRQERRLVFTHERIHLHRGDALWNAMVAALRCLFWFNPLVHLASSWFRADQELACDAAVLRAHPRSRRAYANALLRTQFADSVFPIGCHWQSVQHLKERLTMLTQVTPGRARRRFGYVCITLTAIIFGYTAWSAQPASVPRGQILSMDYSQIDIRAALKLIADAARQNMVIKDSVGGSIAIHVKNVPWTVALEAVLKAGHVEMRRDRDLLIVGSLPELSAR